MRERAVRLSSTAKAEKEKGDTLETDTQSPTNKHSHAIKETENWAINRNDQRISITRRINCFTIDSSQTLVGQATWIKLPLFS